MWKRSPSENIRRVSTVKPWRTYRSGSSESSTLVDHRFWMLSSTARRVSITASLKLRRRRSRSQEDLARLCHAAPGELEQMQFLPGHGSNQMVAAEIHQDGGFRALRPSAPRANRWSVSALLFGREHAYCELAGEQRTRRTAPARRQFMKHGCP